MGSLQILSVDTRYHDDGLFHSAFDFIFIVKRDVNMNEIYFYYFHWDDQCRSFYKIVDIHGRPAILVPLRYILVYSCGARRFLTGVKPVPERCSLVDHCLLAFLFLKLFFSKFNKHFDTTVGSFDWCDVDHEIHACFRGSTDDLYPNWK